MRYFLVLLLVWTSILCARTEEYSATATALSGVTLLSDSVSDYALSPTLGITGLSSFYHRPHGNTDITVLGLHYAIQKWFLIFATGTTYIGHSDYEMHNPYLSASINLFGASIGATQHLIYDSSSSDDGKSILSQDFGIRIENDNFGTEVKYLRFDTDDAAMHFSLKAEPSDGVETATTFVWEPEGDKYYKVSASIFPTSFLTLYSSYQIEPSRFGAGIRIGLDRWSLMYAIRTHPELDMTQSIALDVYW